MSSINIISLLFILSATAEPNTFTDQFQKPQMYYTDTTFGNAFAKDPDVVNFNGTYFMYYSTSRKDKGIAIGIASSKDLVIWKKVADLPPHQACEKRGLAAPAAIVLDGKVHLFYQTYGNGPKDAICHATSSDGIHFDRNGTNPIFHPTGPWNCGRAIDADVIEHNGKLLLYWATRDPDFKIQMAGVASAPMDSGFVRDAWTQLCDESILKPELPWEKRCIEAPSLVRRGDKLFMFYAGAYNNQPQQIGVAQSNDGVAWERMSRYPLLPNGAADEWNSSESGHPGIFEDVDGKTYLFFQGNNNRGISWHLSKMYVKWSNDEPYLIRPRDGKEFHFQK